MTLCQDRGAQNADDHLLTERPFASASAPPVDDLAEPPTASVDVRPLPPLPDGGLAESMPDWLRARPAERAQSAGGDAGTPLVDPTSFLSEEDLPQWIRRLVATEPAGAAEAHRPAPATDEQARSHQPEAIPGRPAPRGHLAAPPPGSPLGSEPTRLRSGERPAPLLVPSTPPPVDEAPARGGRATTRDRETAPLGRPPAAPFDARPGAPTSRQSVTVAPERLEPAAVSPRGRERRVLPIALTVGVIVLAILAYLLGSGMLP